MRPHSVVVSSIIGEVKHLPLTDGWSVGDYVALANPAGKPCVVTVVTADGQSGAVLQHNWHYIPDSNESLDIRLLMGDPISAGVGATVAGVTAIAAKLATLAAIKLFTAFGTTVTLGAVGGFLGKALLGVAFSQITGAITNALATRGSRSGAASADPFEASPTYSLTAQGNLARLNEPMPRLYGRHYIFPDYAATPYFEFRAERQHMKALFILSLGTISVEEVKIGDTPLWTASGGYTGIFENAQIFFFQPNQAVTTFPKEVATSDQVAGQTLDSGDNWVGGFPACAPTKRITQVGIDISFPQGLFQFDIGAGRYVNIPVLVETQARLIDDAGVPAGDWFVLGVNTVTRGSPQPFSQTAYYGVDLGRYEVRMRRQNAPSTDTNVRDIVQWVGLKGITPSENIYPTATAMMIDIQASEQLTQATQNKINVIATGTLPAYDPDTETWSGVVATSNPAWIMADMLRNNTYGAGINDDDIDLVELARLADIFDARGDEFNGVFDTKQSVKAALDKVGGAVRTKVLQVGGAITFVRDEPRPLARLVLTPYSIAQGSVAIRHFINGEETADTIIVEYLDADTQWTPAEVLCQLAGATGTDDPLRIQLFGVTSHEQAYREGMYLAAINKFRRKQLSCETELEGQLLLPNDSVRVTHHLPAWGQHCQIVGRSGNILIADQNLNWSNPAQHFINLKTKDGRQWGPVQVSQGSAASHILMDASSLATVEGAQGAITTVLQTTTLDERLTQCELYVPAVDTGNYKVVDVRNNGIYSNQLTLISDNPAVYTADTGTPPAKGVVANLAAVPDRPEMNGLIASRIIITEITDNLVDVYIGWQDSVGAQRYEIQTSLDNGETWTTIFSGLGLSAQVRLPIGRVLVRGRAIGRLYGAWRNTGIAIGGGWLLWEDESVLLWNDGTPIRLEG